MGKRSRKSKSQFIKIEIIFIILIITCLGFTYYFYNQTNSIKNTNNNLDKKYNEKETILLNKKNELDLLNKTILSYNNLDESIKNTKDKYYKSIKELEDNILNNKSNKKIAYLTFDDGPYYNTYRVLDILDKYDVKATFFTISMNGRYCYDNKSEDCFKLYKEYINRGHTIANHTYTHAIFRGLYSSTDSFMDAIVKQEEHIKEQTGGYVTNIVRFPGGSSTAKGLKNSIIDRLRERGYGWVDWNAGDGDGGDLASYDQARNYLKSSINENIEVILFHDYNGITTDLLPEFIEYLSNNGYLLFPLFYESHMINK